VSPDIYENVCIYQKIWHSVIFINQAKMEMDRLVASVGSKVPPHEGIKVSSRYVCWSVVFYLLRIIV